MAIRIVHIRDLHFGMSGQKEVWEVLTPFLRTKLQPALVLVTGDIADSPDDRLFDSAFDGLKCFIDDNIPCYVCLGNHDRHEQGLSFAGTSGAVKKSASLFTRVWQRWLGPTEKSDAPCVVDSARFDQKLAQLGVLLQPGKAQDIVLTSAAHSNWRLRLLVLDSSLEAAYLAQGFVSPTMLSTLRKSAGQRGSDLDAPDLLIALVHHHLLPVSGLDRDRQEKGGLTAFTTLVNAGTVLETLVDVGVDIALHGHEHCRHLARFGTMARPNDIVVIGAASATGAHTQKGCSFDRSSFNVIELSDNLDVTLLEYRYAQGEWKPEAKVHSLLGPIEIRRARYLRKQIPGAAPSSRVYKQFIFYPTRDAVVRQVTTNCFLEGDRFRVRTENWSGTPYFMGGTVELTSGKSIELHREQPMKPLGERRFGYEQELGLGAGEKTVARRIEHEILWVAGGVLSVDDLMRCPQGARGPLRIDNKEFVEIEVADSLEALSLSIELPDGFTPPPSDFSVLVRNPDGDATVREELQSRLRFSGRNRISLSVPYPLPGYRYLVAWSLPNVPPIATELADERARLERVAARLVDTVHDNVTRLLAGTRLTIAAYLPEVRGGRLSFRAVAPRGEPQPPSRVTPTANQNPFCSAYWGVPQFYFVDDAMTADDAAAGLQDGEYGFFVLPLPTFSGLGGHSVGVIRIATPQRVAYDRRESMLIRSAVAVQASAAEMLEPLRA